MSGLAQILDENSRLRALIATLETMLDAMRRQYQDALELKDEALRHREGEIAERDAKIEAVKAAAEHLARQIELIKLKASRPASQRFVPEEQNLLPFPGAIDPPPRAPVPESEDAKNEPAEPAPAKKRRTGKGPARRNRESFDHLQSRPIACKASPDARCPTCGGVLPVMGQATSFRIEWVPGHFIVEDVARDKCACANAECRDRGAVLTVPGPYALDKALCGNGLAARVIVDKIADHIPLNRQAKRMSREGFEVGSNTLSSWVLGVGSLLKYVALAVRKDLIAGSFLQADDTGHPVQDAGDGTLRKGRMWVFTDQQQAFYAFTPTKQGVFPAELVDGFSGELLLVDGGSEFNQAVRDHGLERAGCWSHLRTYFFDARPHHPVEAALALGTIRDLFMLERTLHGQPASEVLVQRQEHARPLVDGFFEWVEALSTTIRPTSTLGDAVRYARNQEKALRVYLQHGELPMHNNLSELLLRQNVVGRKNWLFSRSEGGAEVAGYLYTLVGSCMLQGIDPHEYLVDILGRLPDYPATRVGELTPRAWRLANQSHTASAA